MRAADLSRRLEKLAAIIRPADSLVAKVDALSPHDREIYERWQTARNIWHQQFDGASGAYEALLAGIEPPHLHWRLTELLFGPEPRIKSDATLDQVREAYNLQTEKWK